MDEWNNPLEPVRAVASERPTPATVARIGIIGIAAAALIAVAILAFGSTAAPAGTLAAGSTSSNSTATVPDLNFGGGGPGGGNGDRGGPGIGGITITAISGSDLSLATADGWTRTITVDSGTTYSKGGATIALGDLKVGDQVGFRETKASDGSYTIDSINVILPSAGGEVTAVSGSTITVKDRNGTSTTIKVTGSTTYDVAGATATLSDIKVGMFLVAEGTHNSDGSLTAATVRAGDQGGPGGYGHGPNGGPGGPNGRPNPNATSAPSATSTSN